VAEPIVTHQPDDRSLLVRAVEWASGATTIAVEMVAPILIGDWIDGRLGIKGVFVILGAVIGFAAGIWSLVRMVEPLRHNRPPKQNENDTHDKPQ